MKKRQIAWLLIMTIFISIGFSAKGSGNAQDPVISLSYFNNTVKPELLNAVSAQIAHMIDDPAEVRARGEQAISEISKDGALQDVARRTLEKLQMQGLYLYSTNGHRIVTLQKDDVISGLSGTTLLLRSGKASVINHPIVNLVRGVEVGVGAPVSQNTNYMLPARDGAGIRILSDKAEVAVDGVYRIVSLRYRAKYFDLADALKKMGLFGGSNIGYELSRGATRTEAAIMLLRLLGEEDEAKVYKGSHPFTDVDAWAKPYIAYAYSKGYMLGVAPNQFGSNHQITANHYMTALLRALGYDDSKGDFVWDYAMKFALTRGYLSQNEYSMITRSEFQRDQMVYLSYYILFANLKGSNTKLLNKLISCGAINPTVANAAIQTVTRPRL